MHRSNTGSQCQSAFWFSLVAVGKLAELLDCHGLLLNVVLSEETRLACDNLLYGSRNHQVVNVVIGAPRLPFLWWDNLGREMKTVLLLLNKSVSFVFDVCLFFVFLGIVNDHDLLK